MPDMRDHPDYANFKGFRPKFTGMISVSDVSRWRVSSGLLVWSFTDRELWFARRKDCQLACDALNDLGITPYTLEPLSDREFGEIVVSRLQW